MSLSNNGLAQRFVNADSPRGDSGRASRMRIDTIDGTRVVIGYNWAIYAAKFDDGFALFGDGYASDDTDVGWAGYSGSTTKHIQAIKGVLEFHNPDFRVVDARPANRNKPDGGPVVATTEELTDLARENITEAHDFTGHFYRKDV